ncbi:hypothetical protein Dimus_010735 [Dionaea muscipula]
MAESPIFTTQFMGRLELSHLMTALPLLVEEVGGLSDAVLEGGLGDVSSEKGPVLGSDSIESQPPFLVAAGLLADGGNGGLEAGELKQIPPA